MKNLIIDRANWNSGHRYKSGRNDYNSLLANKEGKMCCLGFLGEACGIEKEVLQTVAYPYKNNVWPKELFQESNVVIYYGQRMWNRIFAFINDYSDIKIDDSIREAWIKEGFKTVLGYEVEFVGQYET